MLAAIERAARIVVLLAAALAPAGAAAAVGDAADGVARAVSRLGAADPVAGTYLVLVNGNNRYSGDAAEMMARIRRLYLGDETAWPEADDCVPLARPRGSAADRALSALVLGMDGDELDAHWRRLTQATGAEPPRAIGPVRELLRTIARNKGAFGIIAEGEARKLPAKVRVLFRFSARERSDGGTVSVEGLFWAAIRDGGAAGDFATYLETFPEGAFAEPARTRLAALESGDATIAALPAMPAPLTERIILDDPGVGDAIAAFFNDRRVYMPDYSQGEGRHGNTERRFNGRHQARHVRRSLSTHILDGRSVCMRREYVDGMPASRTCGSHPASVAGHEATLPQGVALACGRGADSPVSARVPAGNPARQD